MAPPSPRRSSRARPTLPSTSQQSSVSSGASGRAERNTRSGIKPSSGKSTPSASLSSEPLEDLDDTLLGRRRKRNIELDDEQDRNSRSDNLDMANGSDDLQDEEDEAVRCICGREDYPGPPPEDAPDAEFFLQHELTDDVTGFFVQCDVCKVWQHGACVGIFSAESSPDEYFCEQCRKEFHKIHVGSNGRKYSRYLPTHRPSRAQSRAVTNLNNGARSPKAGGGRHSRNNSANYSSKRRSTMNSRDAAYDDEILRKVIEASKDEAGQDVPEGTRRTKRGRSDSEENPANVKRQRTDSRSASPPALPTETASHEDSDNDSNGRGGSKKTRSARTQREKSEKDDKEKLRQEAANKRKGRAERRRPDDSDISEDAPLAASKTIPAIKSVEQPPASEPPVVDQPTPGTPPPGTTTVSSSHKRGARSHHKKTKGKAPLLKDKEGEHDESPGRSMSRDIQKNEEAVSAPPIAKPAVHEQSKAKHGKSIMPAKMSMLDMKRRVGAIMDFISRTQVDLAAEASPSSSGNQTPRKGESALTAQGAERTPEAVAESIAAAAVKEFKDLSCIEMMDVLTRDMVKWQNTYT